MTVLADLIAGFVVRVGDKRHQTVSVTLSDEHTAFHITSRHTEDSIEIISPRIRVRPDMGITIAGLVKRSEDFQGNVALALSLEKETATGIVIVRDFMVKEPNLKRKGGWWAAQVTDTMPADAREVTLRIEALFTGELTIRGITVTRSR